MPIGPVSPAQQAKIALDAGIRKAIQAPRPLVIGHINQSRRSRPDATPAHIARVLERRFSDVRQSGVRIPVSVSLLM
jgi:hypothetical protein